MNGIEKDEDEQIATTILPKETAANENFRDHWKQVCECTPSMKFVSHKYKDETGIVLIEGQLPSIYGGQGRRRSVDGEKEDIGYGSSQWLNTYRDFPPELHRALSKLDMPEMANLEIKMVAEFQNPERQRDTSELSFNYILLDPRITKDLPNRALNLMPGEQGLFETFISAIFYIGKGTRSRLYSHLYEAIKEHKKKADQVSKKIKKILDIWKDGLGVVVLHCFQNVIPKEAYTREACMIDAVGLKHLTNKNRGHYCGVSEKFLDEEKKEMGMYLLKKALHIFILEGERQIALLDIKVLGC